MESCGHVGSGRRGLTRAALHHLFILSQPTAIFVEAPLPGGSPARPPAASVPSPEEAAPRSATSPVRRATHNLGVRPDAGARRGGCRSASLGRGGARTRGPPPPASSRSPCGHRGTSEVGRRARARARAGRGGEGRRSGARARSWRPAARALPGFPGNPAAAGRGASPAHAQLAGRAGAR